MATYKVIQDIEAEDKLVGPLSFRQFVYFLIAAFLGYLNFIAIAKGAWPVILVLGPPMLFCLFFAWPWSPDQPTEIWALARIRYWFKNRKRVWDQSGVKEFVTITAPKKIERAYTDGLSQTEVKSRLHVLAHTLDSRGWAIKNAYMTVPMQIVRPDQSDRLLDFTVPQQVADVDIRASDDILDEENNPMVSQMSSLIDASTKARREDLMARLQNQAAAMPQLPTPAAVPGWFMQPGAVQPGAMPPVVDVAAIPPASTMQLPQKLDRNVSANARLKTVQPVDVNAPVPIQQAPVGPVKTEAPAPSPSQPDPAILNLAHDNNLDVATLAREAKRARGLDASDGEVVISLH